MQTQLENTFLKQQLALGEAALENACYELADTYFSKAHEEAQWLCEYHIQQQHAHLAVQAYEQLRQCSQARLKQHLSDSTAQEIERALLACSLSIRHNFNVRLYGEKPSLDIETCTAQEPYLAA